MDLIFLSQRTKRLFNCLTAMLEGEESFVAVADILEVNNENQGEKEPPAEKKFSSAP